MQSFLQFRRSGLAAQAQVDRDLEKAQLITSNRSGGNPGVAVDQNSHATAGPVGAPPPVEEEKEAQPRNSSSSDTESPELHHAPERVETSRTRYTETTALGLVLTGIAVRDRAAHEGGGDGGDRIFVVGWEGPSDPQNPRNWSTFRRIAVTMQISLIGIVVTASSGIEATVLPQASAALGVSEVAESLATGEIFVSFFSFSLFLFLSPLSSSSSFFSLFL